MSFTPKHTITSMGVATGSMSVSTQFDVPVHIDAGASTIQVVANGIPSAVVPVTVVSTVMNSTTTTVSSTPNPSVVGQQVTFTSSTTSGGGVPLGTVTFTEGATVWASAVPVNGSGHASFTTTLLGAGSHTLTATFTGSTGWLSSSGNAPAQVVKQASTSTTIRFVLQPVPVFSQASHIYRNGHGLGIGRRHSGGHGHVQEWRHNARHRNPRWQRPRNLYHLRAGDRIAFHFGCLWRQHQF